MCSGSFTASFGGQLPITVALLPTDTVHAVRTVYRRRQTSTDVNGRCAMPSGSLTANFGGNVPINLLPRPPHPAIVTTLLAPSQEQVAVPLTCSQILKPFS